VDMWEDIHGNVCASEMGGCGGYWRMWWRKTRL